MYKGSCHCGNIKWETSALPGWLTRCTCSYCRKSAANWGRVDDKNTTVSYGPHSVIRYIHGDKTLAFVSCGKCGCTTHWESLDPSADQKMKLNFVTSDFDFPASIPVRLFDGADTWQYLDE
jgi:hypothetical protein